ncbi:MAG TPA: glycosyltransferase family 87 protein [Tepidisphaeraceae bacterium]|nr:glycosyltransferase family 87 protein [Tepidisphaeraceae bacterium]
MRILRPDPHHPIRKRLWQASIAIALVVLVAVIHDTVVRLSDRSNQLSLGEDFLPVYAAGTLVRQGRSAELYAIEPIAQIERRVVAEANLEPLPMYGPYLNPPFFAAAYVPFSMLPYRQAAAAWLGVNLLLLGACMVLLVQLLPQGTGWKDWGLIPLLLVLPVPFWQAMCHQQNTFVSLAILSGTVLLWRSAHAGSASAAVWAGVLTGVLFYKPQLACLVAAVLVLTLGWRALAGVCVAGMSLLVFTCLTMPGTIAAWLHQMPPTVRWIQTALHYKWGRQVTPQSFWRLLIQGQAAGPTHTLVTLLSAITMLLIAAALVIAVFRFFRNRRGPAALDRLIAATIAAIPLLMPYYMDYDLLLMAIPAVLLAAEWIRSENSPTRADWITLWSWVALFVAMYVSPGLAGRTRLNLAVPLIGLVAGGSLARCLVTRPVPERMMDDQQPPLVAAA